METIQQVIRELDKKEIEKSYFSEYPVDLFKLTRYAELSVERCREEISNRFQKFITRLESITPENNVENRGILFVYKCIDDCSCLGLDVGLIYESDILKTEDVLKINTYAYEYTPQEEAVGYLVADTKLTQDNMMDVIVSFLYNMSFFGYEQENLEKENIKLDKAIKEMKEHPDRLVTKTTEELFEEMGLPIEEEYPEEDEKRR